MPAGRLSVSSIFVLSICLAVLVAVSINAPRATAAASCPVEPPNPLRMLYRESERIVVARAGETVKLKDAERENERRTIFQVTESLKGDPGEKSLQVYHWVWDEDPNFAGNFRKGDLRLLFLKSTEAEETCGYRIFDMRYGVKKLSDEDLKIYIKRIEELTWIARQDPPDQKEILEWLVRCAEEPATRWEGAYELRVSASLAYPETEEESEDVGEATNAGDESHADENGEAQSSDEQVEVQTEEVAASPSVEGEVVEIPDVSNMEIYGADVDAALINLLTDEQKARLSKALFDSKKLGEGELALFEVVGRWPDARLVPFLVKHLHEVENEPPYEAEQMMHALARTIGDKRLVDLAQKYSEDAIYYESEDTEEEGTTQAEAKDRELIKLTPAQKRARLLRAFLAAVDESLNERNIEAAAR